MKAWPILAAGGFASLVTVNILEYREARRPLPPWAGRVCDEVWTRTRTADATVGWYRACIMQVAKDAQGMEARRAETPESGSVHDSPVAESDASNPFQGTNE